jgi:hypothetical protein
MSLASEGRKTQRVLLREICWCCDAPMRVKTIESAISATRTKLFTAVRVAGTKLDGPL